MHHFQYWIVDLVPSDFSPALTEVGAIAGTELQLIPDKLNWETSLANNPRVVVTPVSDPSGSSVLYIALSPSVQKIPETSVCSPSSTVGCVNSLSYSPSDPLNMFYMSSMHQRPSLASFTVAPSHVQQQLSPNNPATQGVSNHLQSIDPHKSNDEETIDNSFPSRENLSRRLMERVRSRSRSRDHYHSPIEEEASAVSMLKKEDSTSAHLNPVSLIPSLYKSRDHNDHGN
ncbi:unnamed protein product [Protopolystoma xenopodis]|uniref:Uncharacterized protein n=1 Tax=Protopolystoma xenopodis TaxID=117903 RepID=A0A448WJP6_9PLAT|nr:unnamed protein product [Protopolystoma xenopodis]